MASTPVYKNPFTGEVVNVVDAVMEDYEELAKEWLETKNAGRTTAGLVDVEGCDGGKRCETRPPPRRVRLTAFEGNGYACLVTFRRLI